MSEESARRRSAPSWMVMLLATPFTGVGLAAWFLPRKEFPPCGAKPRSDIAAIVEALNDYAIFNDGEYPDSLQALVSFDVKGFKFIDRESVPRDPWGNEYRYEPPRAGQPLRVYSYGADGAPGGEGKDVDIQMESIQ